MYMTTEQTPEGTTYVDAKGLARDLGVDVATLGDLDQDGDMLEYHGDSLVTSAAYAEVFSDQIRDSQAAA